MIDPTVNPIAALLARQSVLILDGGLATTLESLGCHLDDDLWSARVLLEAPELIRRVHLAFLEAGADCLITASYQATLQGYMREGLPEEQAAEVVLRSVGLAAEARDAFWDRPKNRRGRLRPLVAASVGPYGAFLADGSEFTGRYGLDEERLVAFHRDRWHLLAGSGADLLACETLPDRAEARALVRLLRETPEAGAWFSFSCRDGSHISDGSRLADVFGELSDEPQVLAVGVNCTAPRHISSLVAEARRATAKPIVVYPNSGERWDPEGKRWLGADGETDPQGLFREWVEAGARLLGGCCRTGPEYIERLRATLLPAVAQESC